jgi:thioredoxin reductase
MLMYDAVIVGGGVAGLQCALMMGRARRRVLLCDTGDPRNAPATHAHSFLTRDGTPPRELLRLGRADVSAYPSVELREIAVVDAARSGEGFAVTLAGGEIVGTRGLVVASGLRDELPEIPGFRHLWGTGIFFCPFCHGWELRDEPLAVYGQDLYATHMVYVVKNWTNEVTLVPDGPLQLDGEARAKLARNGITVREGSIAALEGNDHGLQRIVFADGGAIRSRGLLYKPHNTPRSDLPAKLGAEIGPDGRPVIVDRHGQTTVPWLFVAGDLASAVPSLLQATASGELAGAGLSNLLALRAADLARAAG